ncbi:hypothetical protein [Brevibacillus fulvus]|uniref:Uncharacterized protein n=1 Tax=Brevibacillus fulvus TaxID=1125967 RepID=A0A938Y103_9BACL|nr:hypothetical protein [Brevibacillus fulvus]MBM7590459.1 hypothetical protein [Brevibacillus fulvus]
MEKTITLAGQQFNLATTYDGDSQYHVQLRNGEQVLHSFKIAAETEQDVIPAAMAHLQADLAMGNLQL